MKLSDIIEYRLNEVKEHGYSGEYIKGWKVIINKIRQLEKQNEKLQQEKNELIECLEISMSYLDEMDLKIIKKVIENKLNKKWEDLSKIKE